MRILLHKKQILDQWMHDERSRSLKAGDQPTLRDHLHPLRRQALFFYPKVVPKLPLSLYSCHATGEVLHAISSAGLPDLLCLRCAIHGSSRRDTPPKQRTILALHHCRLTAVVHHGHRIQFRSPQRILCRAGEIARTSAQGGIVTEEIKSEIQTARRTIRGLISSRDPS